MQLSTDIKTLISSLMVGSVFFFMTLSCNKETTPPLFGLLSANETGVDFNNTIIENDSFNIIQYLYYYNGGGVAIGDINNDGLSDIYLTANQGNNQLYLNKGDLKFENITQKAGVAGNGNWTTGVTMADVNADGWLDIYVCQVGNYKQFKGKNQLFINQKDGTFQEQAKDYGLDHEGLSTQAAFFDYDMDGDLDMYLLSHSVHSTTGFRDTSLRKIPNELSGDRLYQNLSEEFSLETGDNSPLGVGGKFKNVARQAGILSGISGYGLGIAIADIDKNGCPDIYIGNDFHENDFLYLNNCDGTFSESSTKVFGHTSKFSMGNDIADLNNDALAEVMTMDMKPADEVVYRSSAGNDPYDRYQYKLGFGYSHQLPRNMLQWNRGGEILPPDPLMGDATSETLPPDPLKGEPTSKLSLNSSKSPKISSPLGGGGKSNSWAKLHFSEIAQLSPIAATDWSWSVLLADYDNDGWKDIHITNGIVRRPNDLDYIKFSSSQQMQTSASDLELANLMPSGKVSNFIFKNNQDLTFSDASNDWGIQRPSWSNGAAYADLDKDGDLDLVVNNINEPVYIYENKSRQINQNNYLKIRLKGSEKNPFGIGAKVTIYSFDGEQYQEMNPTKGWQSSVDYGLHFGLGDSDLVDYLVVEWPDGKIELVEDIAVNQEIILDYKKAEKQQVELVQNINNQIFVKEKNVADKSVFLNFKHQENRFFDNNREQLMPHLLSTEGPKLAVGDVNGDGLEDVFIGGASKQSGALFLQQKNGQFENTNETIFQKDALSEDVDAIFFDADKDGDLDLYVSSGGNEFYGNNEGLKDRLYQNDGKGKFIKKENALPPIFNQTACVKPADIDGDGDLDLFIGSRSIAVNYGIPPKSYLLINDGKGNFQDATKELAPKLSKIGMVTDAVWTDFDQDKDPDLIIVGEWMPITLLENKGGKIHNLPFTIDHLNGWWSSIAAADFDQDGDEDFIIGNWGLNSNLKASPEEPVRLYLKDLDKNLSKDPILTYFRDGKEYTYANFDELGMQLTYLKKQFREYDKFAKSTFMEVFPKEIIKGAARLEATNFASVYMENKGDGSFDIRNLPLAAQIAPVHSMAINDFDKDGHLDAVLGGNFHAVQPSIGIMDASFGTFLKGDGKGNFELVDNAKTGLWLEGQVRDLESIQIGNQTYLMVARNNESVKFIRQKK